ncbi:MAG: hypothetical protein LAO05_06525 [Acidobacteriia bacterium]|nr:hypothetical protein [Terriglobia bacterium]
MTFLETYGKELVALLVPLVAWALNTFFRARARLSLANPHTFTFLVQTPLVDPQGKQIAASQTVHTRSLIMWNAGKETATRVEWLFNWKPHCLNVWPPRHYQEHIGPDSRYTIVFDSLAPNEYLGCELMSLNAELPSLLVVRSDQCVAQNINMFPQPVISNPQRRIRTALQLAGVGLIVYLAIVLLQFLVLKTPLGR